MGRISIAVWVTLGCGCGCGGRPAPAAVKAEPLIAETSALMDSIERRMPECGLAATMASDQLTLLDQRGRKLRQRCLGDRELCDGYLARLDEVRTTSALSIAVMRSASGGCEAGENQVETWLAAFAGGIDELDGRLDRAEVERSVQYEHSRPVASRHRLRLSRR